MNSSTNRHVPAPELGEYTLHMARLVPNATEYVVSHTDTHTHTHTHTDTPGFVAVGTNGSLKCVTLEQADSVGMQLMFCNSYHLLLHPGPEHIQSMFHFDCLIV